jgi:predicted transcriptional regulator
MKKISRRDRLKIYGDLLSALSHEAVNEKVVLTRVQIQVNVPFDRLKNYVSELSDLGLVQDETSPILTEKGRQFLQEYGRVLEFMKRMGLTY